VGMRRADLLPGVAQAAVPPRVVTDSRRIVARARRRAAVRDVFDLLLLAGVNAIFVRWPDAHVPFLGRHETMLVLAAMNAVLLLCVLTARTLPRWRARRVAATWNAGERRRITL